MSAYLENVALVGASGFLGAEILKALLKQGKHNITVITHLASSATFPSSVTVKKGDLIDSTFLEAALAGQDVIVNMLSFAGLSDEPGILQAAAKAGVRYAFPSMWGASTNPKLEGHLP